MLCLDSMILSHLSLTLPREKKPVGVGEDDDWEEGFGDEEERGESDDDVLEVETSGSRGSVKLRCEDRPVNRPAIRETGLEMPSPVLIIC
jgi:hypothetical protein